ncbi:MAG: hypothetical protein D6767_00045, partial [Candidatus Hydrogenedentota bacterium]
RLRLRNCAEQAFFPFTENCWATFCVISTANFQARATKTKSFQEEAPLTISASQRNAEKRCFLHFSVL